MITAIPGNQNCTQMDRFGIPARQRHIPTYHHQGHRSYNPN